MKLPATLFPSLSASTTTRSAAAPGATASGFGARLGTAFGDALGEALGDAGANTADGLSTEESAGASTANEPAETSGATLPAHGGQLAQAGSERAPANDAAMTQFWAAAQPPPNQHQLDAALMPAPQTPVAAASGGASNGQAPDGGSPDAAADGFAAMPAADPGVGTPAGPRPASGPVTATAALNGGVPVHSGGGAAAPAGAPLAGEGVAPPAVAAATAVTAASPAQTTPSAAVPQGGGTLATAIVGHLGNAFAVSAESAESAAVPDDAGPVAATLQPMPGVAPKFSADIVPARLNSAITAPHVEGETPAPATEPGRQAVDAAVAPAPSASSAPTSAVIPPALPLPTQPPVPAPGSAQQAVPAGTPMLSEQLARPLFALAAAPLGEHVMTINVVPDALGPVTVRAHLAADGIRIEMMSPSDAGREGLRNILADLRRDLAAGGMAASLSMGTGNGSQDHGAGHRSPPGSGNPWNPVARPDDPGPAAHRRLAPSDVPTAANNSLDITV